jgi:hypothetical protein
MTIIRFGTALTVMFIATGCASLLNVASQGVDVQPRSGVWEVRPIGHVNDQWRRMTAGTPTIKLRLTFQPDRTLMATHVAPIAQRAETLPTGLNSLLPKPVWESQTPSGFTFAWLRGYWETGRCQVAIRSVGAHALSERPSYSSELSLTFKTETAMVGRAITTPTVLPSPAITPNPETQARYGADAMARARHASPNPVPLFYLGADQDIEASWLSE